ncbi:hypothetical protein DFH11DRAFT_1579756 [Phellopilus nigrolimitatus]|nr:hypothetical protein DFH11DRAFT_1579756 [Phellopilus nigrolimitatus]
MDVLADASQPRLKPEYSLACTLKHPFYTCTMPFPRFFSDDDSFQYRLPAVVYKLVILAVLVRKSIQISQTDHCSRNFNSPVFAGLIRDTMMYFIVILMVYLGNSLIWTLAPPQLFQIGIGLGVLGLWLLLDLRCAHQRANRFTFTVSLLPSARWDHQFPDSIAR